MPIRSLILLNIPRHNVSALTRYAYWAACLVRQMLWQMLLEFAFRRCFWDSSHCGFPCVHRFVIARLPFFVFNFVFSACVTSCRSRSWPLVKPVSFGSFCLSCPRSPSSPRSSSSFGLTGLISSWLLITLVSWGLAGSYSLQISLHGALTGPFVCVVGFSPA